MRTWTLDAADALKRTEHDHEEARNASGRLGCGGCCRRLGCKAVTSPDGGGTAGDVIVGNIFYKSAHNGSRNPAVDTIAAGATITWAWNATGSHMIQSTGTGQTIFRNSVVFSTANSKYSVTFKNPGTYPYECGVHGAAMTGVIVVQ